MKKIFKSYKENSIFNLFAFLFVFFFVSSFVFYYCGGYQELSTILLVLAVSLITTPIFGLLFTKLSSLRCGLKDIFVPHNNIYELVLLFFIIFLLQIPVFLAFYPGIIFYDIGTQIEQYETGNFVANHPLIHTLIIGKLKNQFDDPNIGYAIATVLQLVILDSCLVYVLDVVKKETKSLVMPIVIALFCGLNPACSMLAISSTKDIIFAGLLCVVTIDIYKIIKNDITRLKLVRMIVVGIIMTLMRNNAIYALVATAIILLVIVRKDKGQFLKLIIYFWLVIIIGRASNLLLIENLDAYKGSIKEMMSIPAQIDARIYNLNDNEEEKALIKQYISRPEDYNYYISDPIKAQLDFDSLDSECKHYLLDSTILSLKHPIIAIDAVWYNTQGYWDMFHSPYQEEHCYLARYADYRGGAYFDTKYPVLAYKYIEHFHFMDFEKWNLFALFVQMGIYSWITLFIFFKSINDNNRPLIAGSLLLVFYMGTLLLGPAAIMRYGLPFILMAPVLIVLAYNVKKQ